jgi:hypothetical protein
VIPPGVKAGNWKFVIWMLIEKVLFTLYSFVYILIIEINMNFNKISHTKPRIPQSEITTEEMSCTYWNPGVSRLENPDADNFHILQRSYRQRA